MNLHQRRIRLWRNESWGFRGFRVFGEFWELGGYYLLLIKHMKVSVNFEIKDLEEMEKINEVLKKIIEKYDVKLEIKSEEMEEDG
jgi:hypothetical protein